MIMTSSFINLRTLYNVPVPDVGLKKDQNSRDYGIQCQIGENNCN